MAPISAPREPSPSMEPPLPRQVGQATRFRTRVPEGATTGLVVVTVDGEPSAGVTFTVTLPAPVISRLDPDSGLVDANVTIEGSNFGTSGTVTFNGTTASTTSWDSRRDSDKRAGRSHLRTGGGDDGRWTAERWSCLHRDHPCAGNLPAGSRFGTGGRQRHHRGVQFRDILGNRHLQRNHRLHHQLGHRRDSDKVCRQGATSGPVVVTTAGGQSSAGVAFTVTLPAPVISRLDPDSGLVDANVTIEGSNFGTSSGTVTFNGTTASTTSWDSDEIQTRVPDGATSRPGGGDDCWWKVERWSLLHRDHSCAGNLPAGSRTRDWWTPASPSKGPISGSQTGTVTFNGTTASTTSWGSDEIQTSVPSGATTGPVVVTTSGGQSSAGVTFTVTLPAPVISRLDPDSGLVDDQRHHRGFQFRVILGNRHLQWNHRLHHQLGQRRDSDKGARRSHLRAGGGDDGWWTVERWGHFHRDHPCAGHLPAGS